MLSFFKRTFYTPPKMSTAFFSSNVIFCRKFLKAALRRLRLQFRITPLETCSCLAPVVDAEGVFPCVDLVDVVDARYCSPYPMSSTRCGLNLEEK